MSSFLKRQITFLISTTLVFSISLIYPSQSSANLKSIQIGFQGPLTGEYGEIGQAQLDAVNYVVKHFNDAFRGNLEIKVIKIDDAGDPDIASRVAPGIASNSDILGLIGSSFSGASIASIPFYRSANLPMISPSATRISLTEPSSGRLGYPVFHRVVSTDKVQGPFLYSLATRGVSIPRVFIIDDQSAYSVGLTQFIKTSSSATSIVGFDSVSDKTTNWSDTISKIRSSSSNVVIFTGYFPQAATLFKQLRDSGYKGILAGGDGILSPNLLTLAPVSALNGVRMSGGTAPLQEISSELEEDFRTKMSRASGVYAAEAIDATNVLLYCIAKGTTTRVQMLNCIDSFKGKSIYGHEFAFDVNGDNSTPTFYSFEVVNGSIKFIKSANHTNAADEIVEDFPWYDLIGDYTDGTKNQNEEVAEKCTAYNDDLDRVLDSVRNAAIEYPLSVQKFLQLLLNAPQRLNCTISVIASLTRDIDAKRLQLSAFQKEFSEIEVDAFEARASQKTITCAKGKKIKKVSGRKPKCPKGYKKK